MSETSLSSSMSLSDFLKSEVVVAPTKKGRDKSTIRIALDDFIESDQKFVIWHGDTMPRYKAADNQLFSPEASYKKAKALLASYQQNREDNQDKTSEVLWYQDNATSSIILLNLRLATTEEVAAFRARQPGEVRGLPKGTVTSASV